MSCDNYCRYEDPVKSSILSTSGTRNSFSSHPEHLFAGPVLVFLFQNSHVSSMVPLSKSHVSAMVPLIGGINDI